MNALFISDRVGGLARGTGVWCFRMAGMIVRPISAIPLCIFALSACGNQTVSHQSHTVVDSAGVRIVVNEVSIWTSEASWSIDETPLLSIGGAKTASSIELFRVVDAVRLSDGTVVIGNGGSFELLFVERDGTLQAVAGGEGDGPGEYQRMAGMSLVGDSLIVFDSAQRRLTVLRLDGTVVRTVRLESTGSQLHPLPLYQLSGVLDDEIVLTPRSALVGMVPHPTVYWDSAPNLTYRWDGTFGDTIGTFSGVERFATLDGPSGSPFTFPLPFGRRSVAGVGDSLFVAGNAEAYELSVFSSGGELQMVVRRVFDGYAVASADVDRAIDERVAAAFPSGDERMPAYRRFLETVPVPSRLPPFQQLLVDSLGFIWVEETPQPFETAQPTWAIFDPDGIWLGEVRLPVSLRVFEIGEDYLLGVSENSDGVEQVQVYNLSRHTG